MKPTWPEITTCTLPHTHLPPATDGTYPTVVRREMMDSSQSIHTVVTLTLLEVIDLKVRVIIGPMVDLLLLCTIKLGFFSYICN
jgi:hypothetical protein